jgi:TolB protein
MLYSGTVLMHRVMGNGGVGLLIVALTAVWPGTAVLAERRPVLDQIDVPHSYYFREMYLPQLSSGPSALAWFPDGNALVYSMQGSLWRQALGSETAEQLTDGPGYDFQPDVAPDGSHIVFVRYNDDATDLHVLDLASGAVSRLTSGADVNLEPRYSPDGRSIAFVSTHGSGHFHVFVGDIADGALAARPLFEERESALPRYYYSRFDHELSPAWLPDGKSLIYVGNPEVAYGTGNIWQAFLDEPGKPRLVRREETTWKARPDVAPDGRRIAYASYLGRQWHQLWVTTIGAGAEPFPLSYGAFDVTAPRWSPDGSRIAYISNEGGNTSIRVQDVVGGHIVAPLPAKRVYLRPMFDFDLRIVDAGGEPVAARVSVTAADGRSYAPANSLVHADDGYDRERSAFEVKYFHTDGYARLRMPAGAARITVWHGFEHEIAQRLVNIAADRENWLSVSVMPLDMPPQWDDWYSGDVHVHMNYGGTYRMTPAALIGQARAEDLDVVFNLVVNKEQRIPDIAYFSPEPDAASTGEVLLLHSQEFHTSYWGHLGLLGLDDHLLLPDYSAYPGTAAASLYPDNATIARLAHAQHAAVGYVHPFDKPAPDPHTDRPLTNELPVDAALGLIDYYEVLGFADHRTSAEVWYRLLNCGARIAAAAGTDAMSNFASLRGPVGLNRTYVRVAQLPATAPDRRDRWLDALQSGASMASNAPLLGLAVEAQQPGGEVALQERRERVQFSGFLRSAVPVDHLQLVHNGVVVKSFDLDADRKSADVDGNVTVEGSGWLLLRAWNDGADPRVFDAYPYATTSPVYLAYRGETPASRADGEYFIAWLDRLRAAAAAHADYNSDEERATVLANIDSARPFFERCAKGAD